MNIKDRYSIAAQMKDYDALENDWAPYLMYFHQRNVRLPHVSTDANGFRRTRDVQGQLYGLDEFVQCNSRPKAVLLGGSTAFGVGATGDAGTVASVLNTLTPCQWLNAGGRAFNSTQEMILLATHVRCDFDTLVIFSGLNNAYMAMNSSKRFSFLPPFYYQNRFERSMRLEAGEILGIQYRFKQLCREIMLKAGLLKLTPAAAAAPPEVIGDILEVFDRDMALLCDLAKARGFKLHFVLQPVASWIRKRLSEEEKKLFAILDQSSSVKLDWLDRFQNPMMEEYICGVQDVCQKRGVDFFDLNVQDDFASDRWLFVDRVHLTDEGYALAARLIAQRIQG